jgi:nanoRNase/pAp phosphatase (c-di-AMP/oligoRNAs hydrolase)
MRKLARIQNPIRPRQFFATLARAIREAVLVRSTLMTRLHEVDTPDRVAQVAEILLQFRGVRWCLVTGRYKGRLHASLRSSKLDAPTSDVLRHAIGNHRQAGGHGAIAGGSCPLGRDPTEENWAAREQELEERLMRRLRVPARADPRRPFAGA